MNAEKRRIARVQGGWSVAGSKQNNTHKQGNMTSASRSAVQDCESTTYHKSLAVSGSSRPALAKVRSDKGRVPMPTVPIWTGKNIDQPAQSKDKFIFEDPEEEIKVRPTDQNITKPGVYDISLEPSGVSRLRYFPQFIDPSRSEAIFAELLDEVPWKQRYETHNGVQAIQPRLTAWFSDLPYTYAGITVEANTSEWPKVLTYLKEQLAEVTGVEFNSLAANLYRDGHDSIGWHSDDEPIMGKNPTIASLSFGEERMFELRKKPPPNESGERDYTYSQVIRIPIRSGALLIMEGWTQSDWQHRVPKEYHDRGARINITFRVAKPFKNLI
uniref:Alpha-ketoglutarate-dependent dioxygenase alkB homolog 3 n=1 Tax=Arion vulgaris TaxID=1028688 RepID=A0A0B6YTA3_9EUPU